MSDETKSGLATQPGQDDVCRHSAQSWTMVLGDGEERMYCSDCESALEQTADGLWHRLSAKAVQS